MLFRANPVIAKVVTGLHQTIGLLRVACSQAVSLEVYLMARIPEIWYHSNRLHIEWFCQMYPDLNLLTTMIEAMGCKEQLGPAERKTASVDAIRA